MVKKNYQPVFARFKSFYTKHEINFFCWFMYKIYTIFLKKIIINLKTIAITEFRPKNLA